MRTLGESCLKVARVLLMLWCHIALICQIITLLIAPRYDQADALALSFTRVEPQSNHLGLTLAVCLLASVGLYGSWKRDARFLKAVSCAPKVAGHNPKAITRLTPSINAQNSPARLPENPLQFALMALLIVVYLHLFWQHQKRGDWQQMRASFAAQMSQLALDYQPAHFDQDGAGRGEGEAEGAETSRATDIWDSLQVSSHCCGLEGPLDWLDKWRQERVPASCCGLLVARSELDRHVVIHRCHLANAEQTGCLERIDTSLRPRFEFAYILVGLMALLLARHFQQIGDPDESSVGGEESNGQATGNHRQERAHRLEERRPSLGAPSRQAMAR